MAERVLNAMSVDVEEHFQVSNFDGVIDRDSWDGQPSRVVSNTTVLLDLFDEMEVKATFFVLGWVAERHPDLVREVARRGHEVGSHGFSHRLVYRQQPSEFADETRRSRALLQDLSGQSVDGYRAASFSITKANLWALEVLAEVGFGYDSSLFPVTHHRYGMPGAERRVHVLTTAAGELIEVPPTTVRFAGRILPAAGGGYLRLFPRGYTRWAFKRLNRTEAMAAVVYIHPWEIDPEQPRVAVPLLRRIRHYHGLRGTAGKLRDLMRRHRFGTLSQVIDEARGDGPLPTVALDDEKC